MTHIFHPNRQGDGAAIASTTHTARFVEANEDGGYDVWVETDKPCVFVVIGRAGFAGNVRATQRQCASSSTVFDDILHDFIHDVGIARVDNLRCVLPGDKRLHLGFEAVLRIIDFVDDIRRNFVAAVRKNSIGFSYL